MDEPLNLSKAQFRLGYLCLNSWTGRTETLVRVRGETPKRYRIEAITRTKLAGRDRWLEPNASTLVPKHAIRFQEQS